RRTGKGSRSDDRRENGTNFTETCDKAREAEGQEQYCGFAPPVSCPARIRPCRSSRRASRGAGAVAGKRAVADGSAGESGSRSAKVYGRFCGEPGWNTLRREISAINMRFLHQG